MSDEFALCWNNFTDNITTGFHSLLLKGDLCDVTLAVDGKLLKAHRVVLSICSPYFQEMFLHTPSNHHPVLILKDMNSKLVSNLLEFMYQGSVNVKQDQLKAFMAIAETLQIKGLTTNPKEQKSNATDASRADKRSREEDNEDDESNNHKQQDRKEHIDLTNDEEFDPEMNEDQFELLPIPEITMMEASYGNGIKMRRSSEGQSCNLRIVESQTLNNLGSFDLNNEPLNNFLETPPKNSNNASMTEIPNEVSPSGSNITMLSSTSLLHGNCIFNRNNTVATQAGLKTYWLCKSYRISMCKARCITHQGKVISATGFHNHLQHMPAKPHELPPDHAPNPSVFIPTTPSLEYSHSSNSASSSAQFMQQQSPPGMLPYYIPPHMNHQMMDQSHSKEFYHNARMAIESDQTCKIDEHT